MLADIIPKIAAMEGENGGKYHPRCSSAGPERCIRQIVYHAGGWERKPFPGRAILVFDDGKWHEELTNDWLRKTAFRLHSEQMAVTIPLPFSSKRFCTTCQKEIEGLHGHMDGILTDITGVDRIYEHKAINHFTFQALWDSEELPQDYLTQLALYIRGSRYDNPDIDEGILLIKNKNTAQYLEFLVRYHADGDVLEVVRKLNSIGEIIEIDVDLETITQRAIERFAKVHDYVEKKTFPARPYERSHWRCDYCGWGEICWDGYKEEVNGRQAVIELPALASAAEIYDLARSEESNQKKRKEAARKEIKDALEENNAKSIICNGYTVGITLKDRSSLDTTLIPPQILAEATVSNISETINVRKIKEPNNVKKSA